MGRSRSSRSSTSPIRSMDRSSRRRFTSLRHERAPRRRRRSSKRSPRAIRMLGLRHGPVHAECRVNDQGIYVLEVAARPIGGLCSKAIRFSHADGGLATLEEVLLRHALGEPVDAYRRINRAVTGVMMIPIPRRGVYRGVSGVENARRIAGIDDVMITAKPDSTLVPLPEGRSYLGFIFATSDTPASVEEALRRPTTDWISASIVK